MERKRNRFSQEEKQKAVMQVLENDASFRSLSKELKTSERVIRRRYYLYERYGESGLSLKNKPYSGEFKLFVVEDLLKNNLSLLESSVKHGITDSVIHSWLKRYQEQGAESLFIETRGRNKMREKKPRKLPDYVTNPVTMEDMQKKLKRLEVENDYLKKLHALIQQEKAQKKNNKRRPSKS